MRRRTVVILALLAVALRLHAQDAAPAAKPAGAIIVTINPEGRVSAVMKGVLPTMFALGAPCAFAVEIVNQGYITGHLEAVLVGNPPAGASLDMDRSALKGTPRESRALRITLANPGSADLTIVFRLRNEMPDLGGIDRIHMLVRVI